MRRSVKELLRNLRSVVFGAASTSKQMRHALAEIRRAGLSVYLVVDGGDEEEPEAIPLVLTGSADSEGRPDFRIDQQDLTILRDLGIDPTRTLRRRR